MMIVLLYLNIIVYQLRNEYVIKRIINQNVLNNNYKYMYISKYIIDIIF